MSIYGVKGQFRNFAYEVMRTFQEGLMMDLSINLSFSMQIRIKFYCFVSLHDHLPHNAKF